MVDHVVEEHAAVGLIAGGGAHEGAFAGEGEGLVPGGVGEGFEGVDEADDEGVVLGEELVAGGHAEDLAGVFGGLHVDAGTGEHEVGEAGEFRGVAGEAGEGHGFGVGGEVVVAVWNGSEDLAGPSSASSSGRSRVERVIWLLFRGKCKCVLTPDGRCFARCLTLRVLEACCVVAAVYEGYFAGDAGGQWGTEEGSGVAYFKGVYVALERASGFYCVEDL